MTPAEFTQFRAAQDARFEEMLQIQEERVRLAQAQVQESVRLQEIERQKVEELAAARAIAERQIALESERQQIERERIAKLDLQGRQLEMVIKLMRNFVQTHNAEHHGPVMDKLNEITQQLTLLVERIVSAMFRSGGGGNAGEMNINLNPMQVAGDLTQRARGNATLSG